MGRAGGGADQCEAPRPRGGLDPVAQRRAGLRGRRGARGSAGRAPVRRLPGVRRWLSRRFGPRCRAGRRARRRRRFLAFLHQRHHRPAQGRAAERAQPALGDDGLPGRGAAGGAWRRDAASGAAFARRRALSPALRGQWRAQRGAGLGWVRARRDRGAGRALAQCVVLRGADDGSPARRLGGPAAAAPRRACDDLLRRRPDVPGRHRARPRRDRSAFRADLRPGRKSDDDHRAAEARDPRPRARAPPRAPGIGRVRPADGGSRRARPGRLGSRGG